MKTTMSNILLFTAGAAIGSLVTWKLMNDKCEEKIQEEVESFKEYWKGYIGEEPSQYSTSEEDFEETEDEEIPEADQYATTTYHNIVSQYKQSEEEGEKGEDVPYVNGPYVITPEEFGDGNFDHDCEALTYYADDILANDWGVKYDIEETIGIESLDHFGDYTEAVVHVRNERTLCDYEVVLDPRKYVDVVMQNPSDHRIEN